MNIKYLKLYEEFDELDPYGEENDEEFGYNGDPVEFLNSLGDMEIITLLENVFDTDDIEERMFYIDEILDIINSNYNEFYETVEDDIRELAIADQH